MRRKGLGKLGRRFHRAGIEQGSTGALHLDGSSPTDINKKCRYPKGYLHFLVRRKGLETLMFLSVKPSRLTVHRTVRIYGSRPLRYKNNPNPQMWFGLFFYGTPKGTRTPDLLIRSQSLYPTALSAHVHSSTALRYNSTVFRKKQVLFSFFSKKFSRIKNKGKSIFLCET